MIIECIIIRMGCKISKIILKPFLDNNDELWDNSLRESIIEANSVNEFMLKLERIKELG